MSIFAQRDISAGEELCHSYVPAHTLLRPRAERANSLHFECHCHRCGIETSSVVDPRYEGMGFPRMFASTPIGKSVGDFKMSTVVGSDGEVVTEGEAMLTAARSVLEERPLAALETLDPLLQAIYNVRLEGGGGDLPAGMEDTVISLWHGAAERLAEEVCVAQSRWSSPIAARHLRDTSRVLLHVITGEGFDLAVIAMESLASIYGQTMDCMREDLAYLGAMAPDWLERANTLCRRVMALMQNRQYRPA
jgi:hypothetical protein